MKILIPAKATHIQKRDKFIGPYNLLEIDIHLDELDMDLKLQLAKEKIDDSMDIFNNTLVDVCEKALEGTTISITKGQSVKDLSPRQLALFVSNIAFQAFAQASEYQNPFKVEVKAPNVKVAEYKKNNKESIKEMERLSKLVKKQVTLDDIMEAIKNIKVTNVVQQAPKISEQKLTTNAIGKEIPLEEIQNENTLINTEPQKKLDGDSDFTRRSSIPFM